VTLGSPRFGSHGAVMADLAFDRLRVGRMEGVRHTAHIRPSLEGVAIDLGPWLGSPMSQLYA
jgi:hypothetical protein